MKVLALVLCLLIPSVPLAQQVEPIERAEITYKGTKGFFFNNEIGTRMLKDLKTLDLERKLNFQLEVKVDFYQEKVNMYKNLLTIEQGISYEWKTAYQNEHELRIKEQQGGGLANKPVFWFGLGFGLSALLSIGLAFGLNQASD